MKRCIYIILLSPLLLTYIDVQSQTNYDSTSQNPQLGIFLGGGYDAFRAGEKYDESGAGGTHHINDEIDFSNTNGYCSNIGLEFKIPFTKNVLLSLEGTEILAFHQFEYRFNEGAFNDGMNITAKYSTYKAFSKFAGILERRYGSKWKYYFGVGFYISEQNNIFSAKGEKSIHTYDSGTPAAPATIYRDTTIYNSDIKISYKTEAGITMLTGVIIPTKHKYSFFIEARYARAFRDSFSNPNLRLSHLVLNAGILFELNF